LPISEIIEKEGYEEVLRQEEPSEFVTIVPAKIIGSQKVVQHPIGQIFQKNKDSKLSPLSILAKSCNCSINKKHGYIMDLSSGNVIKPSQLFSYFGVNTVSAVRCPFPKCNEPISWDLLLWHFEDHKLSLKKLASLFSRYFYDWEFHDSDFWFKGEKITL